MSCDRVPGVAHGDGVGGISDMCRHRRRLGGDVVSYVICALSVSCQAAAMASRRWASANSSCQGQADAIASLIRRTLMRTSAPSFSSFSRIVPQVAVANCVCARPIRRNPHNST